MTVAMTPVMFGMSGVVGDLGIAIHPIWAGFR
jgi:hypothetical protein